MAATPPGDVGPMAPEAPGSVPSGAPDAQRQARYNYLVGRLRSRQITMEEATELFALMQAMLRVSELARRAAPPPPVAGVPAVPHRPPRGAGAAAPSAGADDLFLVGLLAMGAGAGLLAAMARRLAEGPRPAAPTDRAAPGQRTA